MMSDWAWEVVRPIVYGGAMILVAAALALLWLLT